MTDMLQWLWGLERIRLVDGGPISFRFATPPAPWIMLAGAVLAGAAASLAYRRSGLSRRLRWSLIVLRLGVVLTVLFILGRPMLVLRRTIVDPSFVAVLVDRSSSMAAKDIGEDPGAMHRHDRTRWQQVIDALTTPETGLLDQLASRHQLGVWLVGESAVRLDARGTAANTAELARRLEEAAPTGSRTDLAKSISQVLQETAAERLAAIVVVSDGRQTERSDASGPIDEALARSVRVHTLAAGSTLPRRDVAIASVWAPETVFVRDTVSVEYEAVATGYQEPSAVLVELRDESTGALLASQAHELGGERSRVRGAVQYRPDGVGRRRLRLAAVPRPDEENVDNNRADVVVAVHSEKIGVLYVESVPRFEYRYLKNLLLREPDIESSCLLLEATPDFAQEGTLPIQQFPRSVEEMRRYAVIILGDVDPHADWLTPVQQSMIVDFVSIEGGGLAFIAGERSLPHRLRQTALEKLLPVRIEPQFLGRYDGPLLEGFSARLTPDGRASPVFRYQSTSEANDQIVANLPEFFWFARVAGTQPAASVLAVHPSARTAEGLMPLAVLGRFGAGRTFFLGTDDLWRWRQDSGDMYYENIWLQVIYTLARAKKLGPSQPWRLETDRRQYELGETVRATLAAIDEIPIGADGRHEVSVLDEHDALADRFVLTSPGTASRQMDGSFVPRRAGNFTLTTTVPGSGLGDKELTKSISVVALEPEMERLEADHEFLQLLATRTDGQFRRVGLDHQDIASAIPDRSIQLADDIEEPIWDSGLLLGLFIALVATEWTLRRALGLA